MVEITPISLWFIGDISIVNGVYRPIYNVWGAPPWTLLTPENPPKSWSMEAKLKPFPAEQGMQRKFWSHGSKVFQPTCSVQC
jgi:hypothetical protein